MAEDYVQLHEDGAFWRTLPRTVVTFDDTHTCTAASLSDDERAALRIIPLIHTPQPAIDRLTQGVRDAPPQIGAEAATQQWEVFPLPDEEAQANLAQAVQSQVDALWRAADAWQMQYISGVAIGLLTIGVIRGLPKALAVSDWSAALWASYYARKAAVTPYTAVSCDFSSAGPMPYSVPELRAELDL